MPSGVQNGISDGNFEVAADLLINGESYPFLTIDVDLNAYAVSGQISVSVPLTTDDPETGEQTQLDISALAQANPFLPLKVRVGYNEASTTPGPAPMFDLEWGILDETEDTYELDMIDITGRATAAVFQDTAITGTAQYTRLGSDLAQMYFQKAFNLAPSLFASSTIVSSTESPYGGTPVGKTGQTEQQFLKAYRSRSMWDELQDAAIQDAFILRCHNGNFYYGPPPDIATVPIVNLRWIGAPDDPQQGDMLSCKIKHAARRTHAITVRVDGYDGKKKVHNSVTYGPNGFGGAGAQIPSNGVQYRIVHYPGDIPSLRAVAYKVWHDLVHREYIGTVEIVPDAPLMQTIAQSGVDFLVQLTGCKPSHNLLYQVLHAKVNITAGDSEEPSLKVTLLLCNHEDQVGGGEFLS